MSGDMAHETFYDALSPDELEVVEERAAAVLEALGYRGARRAARPDGSRLVEAEAGGHSLGVRLIALEPGAFSPPPFDDEAAAELAPTFRTLCKVGGTVAEDPRGPVLAALAAAAELGRGGRVYDLGALLAMSPEDAERIAREPFDVSRFLTYHYLAPKSGEAEHSWVHLHGMGKFFCPDLEAFDVHPDVSHRALALLLGIAADLAAGVGPRDDAPRAFGRGAWRLRPSEEVRGELGHFSAEDLAEHHDGEALVLEDAGRLGSLTLLLRGAYELEPKTRAECEAERVVWQERLEPVREAWRRASAETVVLRAGLPIGAEAAAEHIWVQVTEWEGGTVRGRLLNDAFGDPAMTRGREVSFDQTRISGVAAFRGQEVLDEVEVLRVVDPAAAAALDAGLEPPSEAPRTVESTSPSGGLTAQFHDDGRVAYLHLRDAAERTRLVEPLWVYNRLPTPPILDARASERGLLPLQSAVYTRQRGPSDAPSAESIEIVWHDDSAMLLLDSQPWAIVIGSARRGWSRLIEVGGRYGRPWDEVEDLVGTVRGEGLEGEGAE